MTDHRWSEALASLIRNTLAAFRPSVSGPIEILAVDCQPWHGSVALAILTREEVERDPALAAPHEMAAWTHYDFQSGLAAWAPADALLATMRADYDAAGAERAAVATAYLRAAAAAATSPAVRDALNTFPLSSAFRVSVTHADTGDEFAQPESAR